MGTPNYVLKENFTWSEGNEARTLEAGTFVRPVNYYYVPKHVRDDDRWRRYDEQKHVFCWCSKGFLMIPRDFVRKI